MPTENRSERASSGRPCDCSGDMYANLPLMTPVADFSRPADRLGDAEVGQLHLALAAEQHVLRA